MEQWSCTVGLLDRIRNRVILQSAKVIARRKKEKTVAGHSWWEAALASCQAVSTTNPGRGHCRPPLLARLQLAHPRVCFRDLCSKQQSKRTCMSAWINSFNKPNISKNRKYNWIGQYCVYQNFGDIGKLKIYNYLLVLVNIVVKLKIATRPFLSMFLESGSLLKQLFNRILYELVPWLGICVQCYCFKICLSMTGSSVIFSVLWLGIKMGELVEVWKVILPSTDTFWYFKTLWRNRASFSFSKGVPFC